MPQINDVIFRYSRAQAILDGTLVDVTEQAKECGFKVSMVCTEAVWRQIEWTDYDDQKKAGACQDTEGRLWDVLSLAIRAAAHSEGDLASFEVLMVPQSGEGLSAKLMPFVLHIGPGDDAEPVCTLMEPTED